MLTIYQNTGKVIYNVDYFGIGHLSKFVNPGAKRILSNQWDSDLENVAFINTDGSKMLVVSNRTKDIRKFKVVCEGDTFNYALDAETSATLRWK